MKPIEKKAADRRRCIGRSRGGLNTKVHAGVTAKGHLVEIRLSAGQNGDGSHGRDLLSDFEPGQFGHVLADGAYDGDENRRQVKALKAKACIKPSRNRVKKKRDGKQRYKNRNQVERFFGRVKRFRRMATRYEKSIQNDTAFFWIAALVSDML